MSIASAKYWLIKPLDKDWEDVGLFDIRKKFVQALNFGNSFFVAKSMLREYSTDMNLEQASDSDYRCELRAELRRNICKNFSGNLLGTVEQISYQKFCISRKKGLLSGQVASNSYKRKHPIVIRADKDSEGKGKSVRIYKKDKDYIVKIQLFDGNTADNWIKFLFNNAKNKDIKLENGKVIEMRPDSRKIIMDRILEETYQPKELKLVYNERLKCWEMIISYEFDEKIKELDYNKYAGLDMGVSNAVYCAIYNSFYRLSFYDFNDLIQKKLLKCYILNKRRKTNKRKYNLRTGRGVAGKTKSQNKALEALQRFEDYICNLISKTVITWLIMNRVGNLILEELSGIKSRANLYLKHWPIFKLQQMIINKAHEAGIKVYFIYPGYTSLTCPKCDLCSKNNRNPDNKGWDKFICSNPECGYEENADYVGAQNIVSFFLKAQEQGLIALKKDKVKEYFGRIATVNKTEVKVIKMSD